MTTSTSHGATTAVRPRWPTCTPRAARRRRARAGWGRRHASPPTVPPRPAAGTRADRGGAVRPPSRTRTARHQRGGSCVGDDGSSSCEHRHQRDHRRERHHRHDVLHEVDGGDGGPVPRDRAQHLAGEASAHEPVLVGHVPERPAVLAHAVAGVREALDHLIGDGERERAPDGELQAGERASLRPDVDPSRHRVLHRERVARHGRSLAASARNVQRASRGGRDRRLRLRHDGERVQDLLEHRLVGLRRHDAARSRAGDRGDRAGHAVLVDDRRVAAGHRRRSRARRRGRPSPGTSSSSTIDSHGLTYWSNMCMPSIQKSASRSATSSVPASSIGVAKLSDAQ